MDYKKLVIRALEAGRASMLRAGNENLNAGGVLIPPPKLPMDRIWDNYAKRMTPDEFLASEPAWSGARQLAEQSGMSEAEAFAHVANDMFQRMNANRFMTPDIARRYMGAARGIKPVGE